MPGDESPQSVNDERAPGADISIQVETAMEREQRGVVWRPS
jgi:post-segregation antitoxin (ccd killing protein)